MGGDIARWSVGANNRCPGEIFTTYFLCGFVCGQCMATCLDVRFGTINSVVSLVLVAQEGCCGRCDLGSGAYLCFIFNECDLKGDLYDTIGKEKHD